MSCRYPGSSRAGAVISLAAIAVLLAPSMAAAQRRGSEPQPGSESRGPSLQVQAPTEAALQSALDQLAKLRAGGNRAAATVTLPPGAYRLQTPLELDSELVGDGLILTAAPGQEPVVLSGGTPLQPRAATPTDGRWRYPLPEGWSDSPAPRVVVIDGQLRSPARHPNHGYFRIERAFEDRRSGFVARRGDLPDELPLGEFPCDLVLLHDWSSSRMPVAAYDPQSRRLRSLGPIGCSADHYAIDHFEKHPRYWLEGHPALADAAGEWFIDPKAGELVLLADRAATEPPTVVLPWLEELIVAKGQPDQPIRNLQLRGLTFTASAFPMPPGGVAGAQATMHEPRGAQGQRTTADRPMLSAAVRVEIATGCRVQDCRFQALGNTALWLGSRTRDCVVQRCRFRDTGGNALNLGENRSRRVDGDSWYRTVPDQVPSGQQVRDCQIARCGRMLPGAVAIWAALQRDLEITGNHLDDCPYTGISLGWIWSEEPSPAGQNHIHGNRIERMMQVLSDGGGIYTLGRQPESVIEDNVITDIPLNAGRAESNGMFLDQGTAGFTIRHNTIRRIAKSPLRFHQAGENRAVENAWTLADAETPPVRYNNTPEENIHLSGNRVLEPKQAIYLIGNSLTWDTVPSRLDGFVRWHVDCGKDLPFIRRHPQDPCVDSSWLWPQTLANSSFDFLCVQPHDGSTLKEDVAAIVSWAEKQPEAVVVVHTGWARHASLAEEFQHDGEVTAMVHSPAYFDALLERLRERLPGREFRRTASLELLHQIGRDARAGDAPIDDIAELYRDSIHMTHSGGRYLMHNAMRIALGQPISRAGFDQLDDDLRAYLDEKLRSIR